MDGTVRATFDLPLVVAGYVLLVAMQDGMADDEVVEAAIRMFLQMPSDIRKAAYEGRK